MSQQITPHRAGEENATATSTKISRVSSLAEVATFELNVTAADSGVTDTLDVFVQTRPIIGSPFIDVVHFTQVLGNGGALREVAKIQLDVAEAAFDPGAALAAAAVLNVLGQEWRARWDIVDGGTPQAVVFTADPTNSFNDVAHGFVADDRVRLAGAPLPTGYFANISYFVLLTDDDNFQLALTSGGPAVVGIGTGTAVTAVASSVFSFTVKGQLAVRNFNGRGS